MRNTSAWQLPQQLTLSLALALAFPMAQAQALATPTSAAPRLSFDIPAGPLQDTLLSIARQGRTPIVFDPALVTPHQAGAVRGNLSPHEAIELALKGSPLSLVVTEGGGLSIRPTAPVPPRDNVPRSAIPPTPKPLAKTSEATPPTLPYAAPAADLGVVEIKAQREALGYAADNARGATRTNTPLMELPQSVSTVSRELMDDQQARTLTEALSNVSSVVIQDGGGLNPNVSINVRGFTVENTMNDGLMGLGSIGMNTPLIGIEGIEVVKGPEGIMGGTSAKYGGVVNMIGKRPQAETIRQVQFNVGTNKTVQLGLDLNSVLSEDKHWRGRVVMSGEKGGRTAAGYDGGRNAYLAPSLAWVDARNKFLTGVELQQQRIAPSDSTFSTTTDMDGVVPMRVLGAPDDHFDNDRARAYFNYERILDDSWQARIRGQSLYNESTGSTWGRTPLSLQPTSTFLLYALRSNYVDRTSSVQADVTKRLAWLGTEHHVLAGVDYWVGKQESDLKTAFNTTPFQFINALTSPPNPSVSTLTNEMPTAASTLKHSETGLLLQDQITLGDHWHALVGARHVQYLTYSGTDPNMSKWLPNFGVVYGPTNDLSYYGSYSEGVTPNLGRRVFGGGSVPANQARQLEVGAKVTFLQQRLALTAAYFRIRETNRVTSDPLHSGFVTLIDGTDSKGLEVELKGRVAPNWNLLAAYTYAEAEDSTGRRLNALPRHLGKLWTTYKFSDPGLRGWSAGGGVTARGRVEGGTFTFTNRGQANVAATVGYERSDWSVNLGVKNLLNQRLYSADSNPFYVIVERGRTVQLTGSLKF